MKYRIFRPITRALSIQKGSEIVKNEHARYTLERWILYLIAATVQRVRFGKVGSGSVVWLRYLVRRKVFHQERVVSHYTARVWLAHYNSASA